MIFLYLLSIIVTSKHFSIGSSTKISCKTYTCGRVPGAYCLGSGSSEEIFFATACPSGTYCSLQGTCINMKEKYQDSESYPGETCTADVPCKYGKCNDQGYCEGKKIGEACSQHY